MGGGERSKRNRINKRKDVIRRGKHKGRGKGVIYEGKEKSKRKWRRKRKRNETQRK